MNIEEIREYCLSIKGAEESLPFDEITLVYKIMGKMFACMSMEPYKDQGFMIILKCDPEVAIDLREKYEFVIPGYHFNKKYWNSIFYEKGVVDEDLKQWILHSVDEVVKKLPKKLQVEYASLENSKSNESE